MRLDNIFFDFDGVIAESVSAKTDAFQEMYLPYGENIANSVVEYHKKNGGVSRYEKFKYFHKYFLNQDIDQVKINELAAQFSKLVLDKVINSEEVLGAKQFIERYYKKYKFWIITGTPTTEIEIIAKKKQLSEYFVGLHGSPENKKYWTEYLIVKYNLKRNKTIFLGDATTDYDAANYSHTHFALRENTENMEIFRNYNGHRFKDYYELEKLLNSFK